MSEVFKIYGYRLVSHNPNVSEDVLGIVIARNESEATAKVTKAYKLYADFDKGDYVIVKRSICYIDSKSPDVIETGKVDFTRITR